MKPDQTGRVGTQTRRGHLHVALRELAAQKQRREQRLRQHGEPNGRRHADDEHQPQSPIERRGKVLRRLFRMLLGQPRQDDGRQRNAEHAERKLDEAVRVVEPADAAGDQKRRDQRVEQNADLRHRRAEDRRHHELQDPPHAVVREPQARPRQEIEASQERQLKRELDDAGDEHSGREAERRPLEQRADPAREHDHDDIEQHRRERGDGETPMRVEHAAGERRQRHEQHVRQREPQHVDGESEPAVVAGEARREDEDDEGCREHAERSDREQADAQRARDVADELASLGMALVRAVLGDDRHERLRERTFGEEAAHEVRDLEGHSEGVHDRPGAEPGRERDVAREARDARQQGHEAHDGRGREQALAVASVGRARFPRS